MVANSKPRKKNYINNFDLYEAIKKHQTSLQKNPDALPSNYIGECFMMMSKKISNKLCFSGYTYKDEFIGDSIENCVKALNNFDPEKSNNPFGYFSSVIHNAFVRRIQKEKKQQYIKLKLTQHHFIFDDAGADEQNDRFDRSLYENNEQYIQEFEASQERKKAKKSPKRKSVSKKLGLDKLIG